MKQGIRRNRISALERDFGSTAVTAAGDSVVQHHTQKRIIDLKAAVIFDEAQLLEFVHEQIDARARGSDHLGQRLLRYFWKHSVMLVLLAVARQQEQGARQPLLRGVE
jgi:hypothetical protein